SFVGAGAVAAKCEPHQTTCRLAWHNLSLEQEVAKSNFGAAMAFGRGKLQPARCLVRIARRAGEIKPPKFVLCVGVTEIGRRIAEHVTRAGAIDHDFRIRYAGEIIMPESNEGVGDEPRLRRARRLIGMGVGDLAEIIERAQIIAWHAIAVGVHAVKLPLRHWLTLLGSVLQRGERASFAWRGLRRMG